MGRIKTQTEKKYETKRETTPSISTKDRMERSDWQITDIETTATTRQSNSQTRRVLLFTVWNCRTASMSSQKRRKQNDPNTPDKIAK